MARIIRKLILVIIFLGFIGYKGFAQQPFIFSVSKGVTFFDQFQPYHSNINPFIIINVPKREIVKVYSDAGKIYNVRDTFYLELFEVGKDSVTIYIEMIGNRYWSERYSIGSLSYAIKPLPSPHQKANGIQKIRSFKLVTTADHFYSNTDNLKILSFKFLYFKDHNDSIQIKSIGYQKTKFTKDEWISILSIVDTKAYIYVSDIEVQTVFGNKFKIPGKFYFVTNYE